MSNLPPAELRSARARGALSRFANRHGPDAGREVDHLKLRSLSTAANEALSAAEAGGLAVASAGALTGQTGHDTVVFWLWDASRFDGDDQL